MGIYISRNAVVKSPRYNEKTGHVRLAIPPDNIPADQYFQHLSITQLRRMTGNQIRKYLRTVCRFPIKDSKGNPYGYRIYILGNSSEADHLETIFPRITHGERVGVEGRLDYDSVLTSLK